MGKLYSNARLILFSLIFILYNSCSEDQSGIEEKQTETNLSVELSEKSSYIVIISNHSAEENSKRAEVLGNVLGEIRGQGGSRILHEYRRTLTGFAAELDKKSFRRLQNDPRVASIVNDKMIYLENLNTQDYPSWGLDRIDQRENLMDRAYAYTHTGAGVTAYIIDSGINYTHSEFGTRASLGYDFVLEENPENTDPDQAPGEDCRGHGTHVAGTIGGRLYGVAKDMDLVSVRVFGCSGGAMISTVLAAVEWVTINAKKPAVVNMSLGGTASPETEPLEIAIQNSIAGGINYVISAGNSNDNACLFTPANVSEAITVGASDISNNKAYFSNYGECVDIYGPGVDITSAVHTDNTSSRELSGTSMSAPHVTGIVGLYLEKNNLATPTEIHTAIIENSTKNYIVGVPEGTNNFVNSLWEEVTFNPPMPPDLGLKVFAIREKGENRISLTWNPTNDDMIEIYRNGERYSQWYNDGLYTLQTNGKGTDAFQICETNYSNCSEIVTPVFVEDPLDMPNQPPNSDFSYQINDFTVQFIDRSGDNDGSIVTWSWDFGDGSSAQVQSPQHTYTQEGYFLVNLTVTDDRGGESSLSRWIKIVQPEPVSLQLTASAYRKKGREYVDLSWTPAGTSSYIDIYKDGEIIGGTANDGEVTIRTQLNSNSGTIFKICIANSTSSCSNEVTVEL